MCPEKRRLRNDILLIAVIFAVALIGFLVFKSTMKTGDYVTVSINGVEKYRYSLSENIQTDIITGENTNRLVIDGGKAYITEADCPDKICVGHRGISKTGETIVCLPHKVVVAVVSGEGEADIIA